MKFLFLFFWSIAFCQTSLPAITYALDCGRFGDQLVNYIKALWISWENDLPFLYKPFSHSEELALSQIHPPFKEERGLKMLPFCSDLSEQALYVVSYYTPHIEEWEDEDFRKLLQKLIKPLKTIIPLKIPKGHISVAIHVRKGGGYDTCQAEAPTKFPPDTFYLSALKKIVNHFKDQPLYVHIFTDDRKPQQIIDLFLKEFKTWENIRIGGRTKKNRYDKLVLEDFFAMTQFDCLIRPDSSFSRAVGALSGPIIEITPPGWNITRQNENGDVIVDHLIKFRPQKGKPISHTQAVPLDELLLKQYLLPK